MLDLEMQIGHFVKVCLFLFSFINIALVKNHGE